MIWNLLEQEVGVEAAAAPPGHEFAGRGLADDAGAKLTGLGLYELPPGQKTWPYHFELSEEEWLIVVSGEVVVRTPDGERRMRAGDVACFPAGPAGAHAVRNDGDVTARYVMPSSRARYSDGAVYLDSGTFVIRSPGGFHHRGRLGEEVEYWEGEV